MIDIKIADVMFDEDLDVIIDKVKLISISEVNILKLWQKLNFYGRQIYLFT